MNPHVESSLFEDDAFMDVHDIYVNDEVTHAVIFVKENILITDVKEHFPEALIDSFYLIAQGLCAIDLKTGKEVSAISANGLFIEFDQWYEYLNYEIRKYFVPDGEELVIEEIYQFEFIHPTSLKCINGTHFSPKLNKNLFLVCEFNLHYYIYFLN